MIELKTYNQTEMFELFKTDRNDVVKRKLTAQGYTFTTEGRGKSIKFILTGYEPPLHWEFKRYCIDELGYDVRTDFDKLYVFFSVFLYEADFRKLSYIQMTRHLEQTMQVSRQTINKWIDKLLNANILGLGNYTYFAHGYDEEGNKRTVEIDRETYNNGWKEYWTGKELGYQEAVSALVYYVSGFPQKVSEKVFNAFEYEKIERLMEIIDKENKANG